MSVDPPLVSGAYFPVPPVNDKAKERNAKLPGMGGVFNSVNLNAYQYAGNNPVKFIDPDGNVNEKAWITGKDSQALYDHLAGDMKSSDPKVSKRASAIMSAIDQAYNYHQEKAKTQHDNFWGVSGIPIGGDKASNNISWMDDSLVGSEYNKVQAVKQGGLLDIISNFGLYIRGSGNGDSPEVRFDQVHFEVDSNGINKVHFDRYNPAGLGVIPHVLYEGSLLKRIDMPTTPTSVGPIDPFGLDKVGGR